MGDLFTKQTAGELRGSSFVSVAEHYLQYYASGKGHTARAKRLDLNHFIEFLKRRYGYSKPEKITVADWDSSSVNDFVEDRLERGEAPSTVARRLATIKHMGRTLSERSSGFINPAREVKPPKVKTARPKALSREQIDAAKDKALRRKTQKQSFIRFRNEVLFALLLDTGLRADEVRLLRMGQLDESNSWIKNVRTKGRRYRNVYITSKMQPLLAEYLEEREKKLKSLYSRLTKTEDRSLPLFISTYNAVPGDSETFLMGAKTIWRAINELTTDTDLHPHLLRHSYALELLESSNDVRLVAQALGHSDVRITMRYTEREEQEIAAALEKSRS